MSNYNIINHRSLSHHKLISPYFRDIHTRVENYSHFVSELGSQTFKIQHFKQVIRMCLICTKLIQSLIVPCISNLRTLQYRVGLKNSLTPARNIFFSISLSWATYLYTFSRPIARNHNLMISFTLNPNPLPSKPVSSGLSQLKRRISSLSILHTDKSQSFLFRLFQHHFSDPYNYQKNRHKNVKG